MTLHRRAKGMKNLMDKQEIILLHFRDGKSQLQILTDENHTNIIYIVGMAIIISILVP
jgi:hypothetical protein